VAILVVADFHRGSYQICARADRMMASAQRRSLPSYLAAPTRRTRPAYLRRAHKGRDHRP
jgi:hypothetical protein